MIITKVYLPAIEGHVPDDVVCTFRAFLEFCHLVRRDVITDETLVALRDALSRFHRYREIFCTTGVRCRACSTPERTAINIVIAPIARAHRAAPHTPAPCSCSSCSPLLMLVLSAPCSCSHCSLSRCLLLTHAAPCSCSLRSCSSCSCSCARAPFARSSLFRLWRCSRTFPSPRVRAIPYLGFASQRLA